MRLVLNVSYDPTDDYSLSEEQLRMNLQSIGIDNLEEHEADLEQLIAQIKGS